MDNVSLTLDALGNWGNFKEGMAQGAWTLDQTRAANAANEIDTNASHADGAVGSITGSGTGNWADPVYDANGNMTVVPDPKTLEAGLNCKYDAWNRLVKVTRGAGEDEKTVAEYVYDGLNRRVMKKTYDGSGTLAETRHFYLSTDNQVLEERVGTAETANVQYVWGLRYVDDLVCRDRDASTTPDGVLEERYYAMQDANWNVVAIASWSGTVQERFDYAAYGKSTVLTGNFASGTDTKAWTVRFAGRELDQETGFGYNRARYEHYELGRFIQRDPILYAGRDLDLYGYCGNRPTNATDPTGLVIVSHNGSIVGAPVTDVGLNDPVIVNMVSFNTPSSDYLGWSSMMPGITHTGLRTTLDKEEIVGHAGNEMFRRLKEDTCFNCVKELNVSGHGSGVGVNFSGKMVVGSNFNTTTDPQILRAIATLLCPNAVVNLWGCYSGEDEKGLQDMANILQAKVCGCDNDTKFSLGQGKPVCEGAWHCKTPNKPDPRMDKTRAFLEEERKRKK
jgi:RHS repeat-associated protein